MKTLAAVVLLSLPAGAFAAVRGTGLAPRTVSPMSFGVGGVPAPAWPTRGGLGTSFLPLRDQAPSLLQGVPPPLPPSVIPGFSNEPSRPLSTPETYSLSPSRSGVGVLSAPSAGAAAAFKNRLIEGSRGLKNPLAELSLALPGASAAEKSKVLADRLWELLVGGRSQAPADSNAPRPNEPLFAKEALRPPEGVAPAALSESGTARDSAGGGLGIASGSLAAEPRESGMAPGSSPNPAAEAREPGTVPDSPPALIAMRVFDRFLNLDFFSADAGASGLSSANATAKTARWKFFEPAATGFHESPATARDPLSSFSLSRQPRLLTGFSSSVWDNPRSEPATPRLTPISRAAMGLPDGLGQTANLWLILSLLPIFAVALAGRRLFS